MKKLFTLVLPMLLALIGSTAWYHNHANASDPDQALPAFSLQTLDGGTFNSSDWHDRVLIINFWATWCPPCREEMPEFVKLQSEFADKGVQFVGIAIDDKDRVAHFVQQQKIGFPILLGGFQGSEISKRLGNRHGGLPYTVVVAKGGEIKMAQAGAMTYDQLKTILDKLTST